MFTGLVQEIGRVTNLNKIGNGVNLSIYCEDLISKINIDDSVSVNGCCQTVVSVNKNVFSVNIVESTLKKTNLGSLYNGELVNLELALLPTTRLGGHIVQGHINSICRVVSIAKIDHFYKIKINYLEDKFQKMILKEGSITINGVSLTISDVFDEQNELEVYIIPHTWENTALKNLRVNSNVNVEFDIIAQYLNRIFEKRNLLKENKGEKLINFLNGC